MKEQTSEKSTEARGGWAIRSPHPGVKIVLRKMDSGDIYHARWRDPDTKRTMQVSLNQLGVSKATARRQWAIKKSKSIRQRMAELDSGEPVRTSTSIAVAFKNYIEEAGKVLKPTTLAAYGQGFSPFISWASDVAVHSVEDLTPARLASFRLHFVVRMKRTQAKGSKRGARIATELKRSPITVNKGLRSVRLLLNHWRRLGLTPMLSSDTISDSLRYTKISRPLPEFLTQAEVHTLFEAAIKHDKTKFKATRAELKLKKDPGGTARHVPIAPLIAATLLSGMRFGEIANLRWAEIDFKQAEIRLSHTSTKTSHGRRIGLAESPMLLELLESLKSRNGQAPYIWGLAPYRRDLAEAARKRLIGHFGAPDFTWHDLRRTCGTHLTCAPNIYGAASAFLSAKRLGHSVIVAERHYVGAVGNIDRNARTLEDALRLHEPMEKILERVKAQTSQPASSTAT